MTIFGSRVLLSTVTAVAICLGTVAIVYLYAVTIAGAASGLADVKLQIVVGGLIAAALAAVLGIYYAQQAVSNVRRLQDAAREVAEGNFETTIPVASAGQLILLGVDGAYGWLLIIHDNSEAASVTFQTADTTLTAYGTCAK